MCIYKQSGLLCFSTKRSDTDKIAKGTEILESHVEFIIIDPRLEKADLYVKWKQKAMFNFLFFLLLNLFFQCLSSGLFLTSVINVLVVYRVRMLPNSHNVQSIHCAVT